MKLYASQSKEEPWTILKHKQEGIGFDATSELADSMSNRWNEIVKNKSEPIRYGNLQFAYIYLFFLTCLYWVDAKVSADFFSFLCFKFLLKQNTINQQRIYHCYL